MGVTDEQVIRFMGLFDGLRVAFGTGKGEWVKRPPTTADFERHLNGEGPGIGVAPLRPDSTVMFAAIDLDEPDFKAAREMQGYIPGTTFVESSRSGNAHVWAFFSDPIEAWIPMGILKEATLAADKAHVEVFPKNHDFSKVKLGNYINLPFHGDQRPVFRIEPLDSTDHWHPDLQAAADREAYFYTLDDFLDEAEESLNDPADWRKKAGWLSINPPGQRERSTEFGAQRQLHMCGEYIMEHAEDVPIRKGHRAAVYFALAKQLTNWQDVDHDEALMLMRGVNDASPDKVPDSELRRILGNAERGEFTSTGCDDPLVAPYAHPDCPIAHPRR